MKKIGITCGFMYPDDKRMWYGKKTLSYVENDMISFFSKNGYIPVMIPNLEQESLEDLLWELDAIVLHGGSDVAPEMYGETPIGNWLGDRYRDEYELRVIDYAVKHNKILLGICRGCQILNVYFGGTLYQDIATQVGETINHRDSDAYDFNHHKIQIVENTFFADLYKDAKSLYVNSIHHQAVKTLGKNLEALCISPDDGIVEAFHYKDANTEAGRIMGIQWHPEFNYLLKDKLLDADLLLDFFLNLIDEELPF